MEHVVSSVFRAIIRSFFILILSNFSSITFSNLFDFDDPELTSFSAAHADIELTRQLPSKEETLNFLDQIGLINLLEEDFYLKTNDLNKRSILDLPLFVDTWCKPCNRTFGLYTFINQSNRKNFTNKQDIISAYLSVGNRSFLDKLRVVLAEIAELGIGDIGPGVVTETLSLFEQFTVQERRVGFMCVSDKKYQQAHLRIFVPFYLHERNFFVNCQIQQALQEILDPILGTPHPEEEKQFQENHLISDTLGIGDTRIECDFPIIDRYKRKVCLGFLVTIPTALHFEKGIYGSFFKRKRTRESINIRLLAAEDDSAEALELQQSLERFFLGTIDTLAAIVLDSRLGNFRHLGVGILLNSHICLSSLIPRPWAESILLKSRLSIEYLFPSRERLFFIEKNNASEFEDRDFSFEDNLKKICDNFEFITQTITNRFYPFSFRTTVHPGLIFRSTTRGIYEGNKWGISLGLDTYVQTKKKISHVRSPLNQLKKLAISKAEGPWIWQSKLIGGILYHIRRPYRTWLLSFEGDYTYLNRGLGTDFSLSLNVNVNF